MTARGVGNMPGTIYRNLFKLKKKKSKNKLMTNVHSNLEEEKQEKLLYLIISLKY